ncbi:MAG: glycerol-3-phosphate acyltransferase [Burkholderiaceae bacterium]|jgi:glycerol-3-phosphate acyltransferase PlsY|nr:glycerol-3-phosphate acyltransferase [Burkholderiaceae bacterium]
MLQRGILCRALGEKNDLRQQGSGTLGARNVYRLYGLRMAVPVFMFDLLKIWPSLHLLTAYNAASPVSHTLVVFAGLLGHIYPVQLGFKGGKGVAVFIGSALYIVILPPTTWIFFVNLLLVLFAHRKKRSRYAIKMADTDEEFDQIFALNYHTFVEEIPQHEPNILKKLKDKFHEKNTYFLCKDGNIIAGMIACCGKRPFSLDAKVDNLDSYLPPHDKIYEIRLLAVKKEYRRTRVTAMLLRALAKHLLENKVDLAVISGTTRQLAMYEKIGFQPFHKIVGEAGAQYLPMYITKKYLRSARWLR